MYRRWKKWHVPPSWVNIFFLLRIYFFDISNHFWKDFEQKIFFEKYNKNKKTSFEENVMYPYLLEELFSAPCVVLSNLIHANLDWVEDIDDNPVHWAVNRSSEQIHLRILWNAVFVSVDCLRLVYSQWTQTSLELNEAEYSLASWRFEWPHSFYEPVSICWYLSIFP